MIRYSLTKKGVQKIEEICEHCGEPIKELHISEITTLAPNDNRTIKILGKDGKTYENVKTKAKLLEEKADGYVREGLLDDSDAKLIKKGTKKELKYGVRPEAMCSQSIDIVAKVTASFCYKTDSTAFKAKTSGSKSFDQIFNDSSEKKSTILGRKVGIDRKGNIIRMMSEKNLDEDDSKIKYHGQFKESWFRALNSKTQQLYLEKAQECKVAIKEFGADACEDGSIMSNFKTADDYKKYIDKNCG